MALNNNQDRIYQESALDTTFRIHESDADSLFSTGSHQLVADDDDDDDDDRQDDHQTLLPLTHHANSSSSSIFSFETIPMIPLAQTQARGPELQKKVSFGNGLGLVVGMMIGSGLFSSPGPVLASSGAYGTALVVWLVSGLLALCGALCYAELGTILPMNGGEAVYLGRAFGSLVSFMFEFVTIVIQKPGSLAIICIVFGDYVSRIAYHTYFFNVPHDSDASVELADSVIPTFLPKLLAVICLCVLTLVNALSVRAGIRVQDVLTVVKVLTAIVISIVGVVVLANKDLVVGNSLEGDPFQGFGSISFGQFAVAFYSDMTGLWAYEGWNNLNYVSGEMKDPHRDLPRVIIFGIPLVIFCYLLSNVAYLAALRPQVVMHTNTVAMDFGKKIFGPAGGIVFAVCVALSCFGSANASVFTGARIIYVSAKQGHIPSFFGKLSPLRHTPVLALLLQACLTTVMIMIGSFRMLVNFYSLSAWIFYFLAVLSLLVFRYTEPDLKRPYRVWLSTPVLFCLVALFLCTTPFIEAPIESAIALGIVLLAVPVWLVHVKFRAAIARGWDSITSRFQTRTSRQGYHGMEMVEPAE
ncbi:hypothetical protein [Parasitella parasitica]|uniref:Amino acid permease/ SLC12A domain-containing protein n=1 Tax=Parasitella parasitica TaxID=35722 RepID=A0A0B7N9Z5_9FUNG|nr:hypothetical protein [Parasitella parasitica]